MPGCTRNCGRPNRSATQPPNFHHSHADVTDDSTPRQNEIAISTMRDCCSCRYSARACTRSCVRATSDGAGGDGHRAQQLSGLIEVLGVGGAFRAAFQMRLQPVGVARGNVFGTAAHDQFQRAIVIVVGHCAPPFWSLPRVFPRNGAAADAGRSRRDKSWSSPSPAGCESAWQSPPASSAPGSAAPAPRETAAARAPALRRIVPAAVGLRPVRRATARSPAARRARRPRGPASRRAWRDCACAGSRWQRCAPIDISQVTKRLRPS